MFVFVISWILSIFVQKPIYAAAPIGSFEVLSGNTISGWAADDDFSGPIMLHLYVDGSFNDVFWADKLTSSHGNHGFQYTFYPFGPGNHRFEIYAIGVDQNGSPNNENMILPGSPKNLITGCVDITDSYTNQDWCKNAPQYWQNRQQDTVILANKYVKIGIDKAIGGMSLQLYSQDRSYNLLDEHAGSALQLSLYGYDTTGGDVFKWFGAQYFPPQICNTTRFDTESECKKSFSTCVPRHFAYGKHVADCQTVQIRNYQDVAFPWDPAQSGEICPNGQCHTKPLTSSTYLNISDYHDGYHTILEAPGDYSKTNINGVDGFSGLTFDQTTTLGDAYVTLNYRIAYSGPYNMAKHMQELPSLSTSKDLNSHYYYYAGSQPFSDASSSITEVYPPIDQESFLALPGYKTDNFPRNPAPQDYGVYWDLQNPLGHATEGWATHCSNDNSKCITIAVFNPMIQRISIRNFHGADTSQGTYFSPTTPFAITPGLDLTFKVYIFPYKYDTIINGKSIRERIFELAKGDGAVVSTPTQVPTATSLPTKPLVSGDTNHDGQVNLQDFLTWKGEYIGSLTTHDADFNHNGTTDISDFVTWKTGYSQNN